MKTKLICALPHDTEKKEQQMYDLNSAKRSKLIPAGIYRVKAKLRPGGFGEEQLERLAGSKRTRALDLELTVIRGEHSGRKIWDLITVVADLSNNNPKLAFIDEEQAGKYQLAVEIGLAKLRAMLESAYEISNEDESEQAAGMRRIASLRVFDGLEFWAKIDIKEGANGYDDRNVVAKVLTPDMRDWPGTPPSLPPLGKAMDDEIPFLLAFGIFLAGLVSNASSLIT
jgi:hypothetical protein